MNCGPQAPLSQADYDNAFTEVSFLLDIFGSTIDDLMGGATDTVGRVAGRQMAKKLPLYLKDPRLEVVLEALAKHFKAGFELRATCQPDHAELAFGHCLVREVCANRKIPLGGPLCHIFHAYLDGMVNELNFRPTKSTFEALPGECRVRMEIR